VCRDFGRQGLGSDHLLHHERALASPEPGQTQRADLRLGRPRRSELPPKSKHAQHRHPLDALNHEVQKLQGSRVDPVPVLVDHEGRAIGRKSLELIDQHLQCALLLALRREVEGRVPIMRRHPEQRRYERRRLIELVGAARQQRLQLI
jgi:hypothetical protein